MYLVLLGYFIATALLALVLVTQVFIPLYKKTKIFPDFRRSRGETLDELADVNDQLDIQSLKEEVETKKSKLKQ